LLSENRIEPLTRLAPLRH
jgi:hypothetical protein